MSDQVNATLYYNHYSICSLMTRLTYRYRGKPADPKRAIVAEEKNVNIFVGDQLTEHFLCDLNPKGEVPVLEVYDERVIPDSKAITYYLGEIYPNLIPASHKTQIKALIEKLHEISFFALTYGTKTDVMHYQLKQILDKKEGVSDRHQKALQRKYDWTNGHRAPELTEENIKHSENFAQEVMKEYEDVLTGSNSGWLLGFTQPSALDAHLAVFIARMYDMERQHLIPKALQDYASKFFESDVWINLMQAKTTNPFDAYKRGHSFENGQ